MNTRTAGGKALLGSALLIALALGSSFWLVAAEQRRLYNQDLTRQLLTAARMLREALREGWGSLDAGGIAGLVHTLRAEGASVVVVSADGHVLVDTVGDSRIADGLLEQPEVRQALLTGWGEQTRHLLDDPHQSRIVAVRVGDDESTLGVVWLARPAWTVRAAWDSLGKLIAAISAIALLTTLILALVLTYVRARLLRRLVETARSLSAGDLSARSEVGGSDELAMLSSALNRMRKRFAEQVETIDRQRLTLESLVDQLHEGVIVTRPDGCIALINPAAAELLDLSTDAHADRRTMVGLPLECCIPHYDFQRMLRGEQVEQGVPLHIDTPAGIVHLLARVSDVRLPETGPDGKRSSPGRMLVLTDITELARIIRIKSDFVANASHELRTPLTAIRAAVETLLQMDPAQDASAVRRFHESIDRQSARLEAMVSDLLDLSRLESPTTRFEPQALSIQRELDELHARFADRLESKEIAWETHPLEDTSRTVVAHPHLFRLVLDNLVDNAIKFTKPGGHVQVACAAGPGWTSFEVVDDGCGIPEAEQERVFERFYQVERARSGNERGTGLGLSIVRHAAAAMNGTVTLKSAPGEGTRVTIRVLQAPPSSPHENDHTRASTH